MDFGFQTLKKWMRGEHIVLNCNFTGSKDNPPMLKRKPLIQEDLLRLKPERMTESAINKLPPEIFAYILCKVSAIDLHSLRCVCKSWDLLIRETSFINQFLISRANGKDSGIILLSSPCQIKNKVQITYYSQKNFSVKFYEEGSSFNFYLEIYMSEHMKEPYYGMTNSCHGLICFFGLASIIVTNPSIGRLSALPKGSLHFKECETVRDIPLVGIGFDPLTRTCKVVRIFRYNSIPKRNNNKLSMRCEVYKLRGGGGGCSSWTYIGEAPISPKVINSRDNFPVVVNNAIHWIIRRQHYYDKPRPKIALSFNIKDETFSLLPRPEGLLICLYTSLMELDGCLSVHNTHFSGEQMDIWMLKDYDNHEWVKQYSIDLRAIHKWSFCYGIRAKPVMVVDGKMVFYNEEGKMDYYDLESKTFVKHEMLVVSNLSCAPYTGGSIWPEL